MRFFFKHRYIFLLSIITISTIIAASLFPKESLLYIILIGIATTILGAIVTMGVERILDRIPMPTIKIYSDYDKNVQEIDKFLQWLVKTVKVCDLATLYVRDELDNKEFAIIANHGLNDSSPMYGPLVFDDFRLSLGKAEEESFVEEVSSTQGENPKGFRVREKVVSLASFKLADKHGNSLAALYLNWRNKQEFTAKKKRELAQYKKKIFNAIEKIEGISIKRQVSNNAELRVRRWIDYHAAEKNYKDLDELIFESIYRYFEFESIYRFFEDVDRSMFKIEIWRPDDNGFSINKKDYVTPYGVPYTHKSDPNVDEPHIRFVIETTRPKFLSNSLDHKNNAYKIIIPIRLLSDLSKCSGAILIECVYKLFFPEMVKPLCHLADHFSRIEAKKLGKKQIKI